jgi:hypothetical protein
MLCSTPRSHCVVFLRVHLISSTKCWLGVFSTTSASYNLLRTIPYHEIQDYYIVWFKLVYFYLHKHFWHIQIRVIFLCAICLCYFNLCICRVVIINVTLVNSWVVEKLYDKINSISHVFHDKIKVLYIQ